MDNSLPRYGDSQADTRRAVNALAEAVELALAGAALFATSTTPLTIGTGVVVLTVEADRTFLYALGYVEIADRDDETRFLLGKVQSYEGTQLTVNVDDFGGSGSGSNWIIGIAGRRA